MLEWELNGDEPKRELITDMQTAQDRLQRLFNDLRGYASPARLHVRPCNIRTLLTQAWDSIQPLHQGRAASLQDVSSASSTEWVADPFQLEQVFRNILENALAACDDPVQITVDCHVEHVGDRATLRIVVRDNGPGLTLDQQERLFEPFFTTKTHGTGLGMAIVRQIIDAHSGTVAARCGDSAGTEILIKFPYVNWGSTEFTEMTEICHA
jgi:signal transduction histidine kinase